MAKKTSKKRSVFGTLPKAVDEVVGRAEKLLSETWDQALDLLPPRPRKTVKDVSARVAKARIELRKQGQAVLKRVDARRGRIVATIEKQAQQALKPIVRTLDVASRAELESLRKRLTQLERRIEQAASRVAA